MKLLMQGATAPPFSMKTYEPAKGEKENIEIIKEISRTAYGRSRAEVEQEIIDRHQKQPAPVSAAPAGAAPPASVDL